MLKATILILYIGTGSPVTAEFATPEACEAAAQKAGEARLTSSWASRWVCVPKGEPVPAVPQSR